MYAKQALQSAEETGRRKDCLRSAVQSLQGALMNVVGEDAEAAAAERLTHDR
jgi:hypothetical protein